MLFSYLHCHLAPKQSRFVNTQSLIEYLCFSKMGVSERNWSHFATQSTFSTLFTSRLVLLVPPGSTSSFHNLLLSFPIWTLLSVRSSSFEWEQPQLTRSRLYSSYDGRPGIPKRTFYNKCSVNCTDQHKSLHPPPADPNEGRYVPLTWGGKSLYTSITRERTASPQLI